MTQPAWIHRFETLADLNAVMGDMPRYWALENDVLGSLDLHPADPVLARRQIWLSAVLFGALLNPADWPAWCVALSRAKQLPTPVSLYFRSDRDRSVRQWYADPLTAALLQRHVRRRGSHQNADFTNFTKLTSLLTLDDDSFASELHGWILAGARLKFTWQLPPVLMEYAVGELEAQSLPPGWETFYWLGQSAEHLFPYEKCEAFDETVAAVLARVAEPVQPYRPRIDDRFTYLRAPIAGVVEAVGDDKKFTLLQQRRLIRTALGKIIDWRLERKNIDLSGSVGTAITTWFYDGCPWSSRQRGRPKVVSAKTMIRYTEVLGTSNRWAALWKRPLSDVYDTDLVTTLHGAIAAKSEDNRSKAYWTANRLYRYLGNKSLPVPPNVYIGDKDDVPTGIRAHILTGDRYVEVLQLLERHPGTPAQRASCLLAAILMFRTGMRGREVINLTTGAIDIADGIVELRVERSAYMRLKTPTSKRTLPLNVLLSPGELDFLLRIRADKVKTYRGQEPYPRLLFDHPLRDSDYTVLLDPIETAIRLTCAIERPKNAETLPAYIYSRCSILRHSFVSYAVASLLLPRDQGRLPLPEFLTPDLVSLDRRNQLEAALLAPGHLGLSSIQAVRQLVGHAGYRRTISTYTHLLDVLLAAHCGRRSVEPAIPALVVLNLAGQAGVGTSANEQSLIRTAFNWVKAQEEEARAAVDSLTEGASPAPHFPARRRRRDGNELRPWEVEGNSFWSQICPIPAEIPPGVASYNYRFVSNVTPRWRELDAILQMASREVPPAIIAEELNMAVADVHRVMDRFFQLLAMAKGPRVGGPKGAHVIEGQLRNAIVIDEKKPRTSAPWRNDDGSWDGPLRPIPIVLNEPIDTIWEGLLDMLRLKKDRRFIDLVRFLTKHDKGRYRLRSKDRADRIAALFNMLYASTGTPIMKATVFETHKKPKNRKETSKHVVRLDRTTQSGDQWLAAGLTVYLLMLACLERFSDLSPLLVQSSRVSRQALPVGA